MMEIAIWYYGFHLPIWNILTFDLQILNFEGDFWEILIFKNILLKVIPF